MFASALFVALFAQTKPKTWDLVCGGDIMLNGVSSKTNVFKEMRVEREALLYANLEIPLTNTSERTKMKTAEEIRNRDQYVLKADPKHIGNLKSAGFDVVSLGNNHTMDGGVPGLRQMLPILDQAKIAYCGAGENWAAAIRPTVVTSSTGTKVAFISYLSFLNSVSLRKCTPAKTSEPGIAALTLHGKNGPKEVALIKSIVTKAKQGADVLVVCLHWGVEKAPLPSKYQVDMARLFVDAGADVIVGNHPHVLQPSELYKEKPIIYSIGNLVNPRSGNTALYRLRFEGNRLISATASNWRYENGRVRIATQKTQAFLSAESALEKMNQSQGLIKAFIRKNLKLNSKPPVL
jgi:poly-gamma-glutamate capsule biosynthesis protein CapA/YwtB (metallophosphatase superfamily)